MASCIFTKAIQAKRYNSKAGLSDSSVSYKLISSEVKSQSLLKAKHTTAVLPENLSGMFLECYLTNIEHKFFDKILPVCI